MTNHGSIVDDMLVCVVRLTVLPSSDILAPGAMSSVMGHNEEEDIAAMALDEMGPIIMLAKTEDVVVRHETGICEQPMEAN